MQTNINKLYISLQIILLTIWFVTHNAFYVTICETILVFFLLIDKLGKGILLRETIALHTSVVLLLMPMLGYLYYTIENPISRLFVKYMIVSEYTYFSFVLPGIILFNLTLCWPIYAENARDEGYNFLIKFKAKIQLLNSCNINTSAILIIGTGVYLINSYLPSSLQYVGFLAFLTSFVGFLMLYFRGYTKYKKLFLLYFIIFLSYVTLQNGMFTIIVYMGMTIFSFLFLGKYLSFWKKSVYFLAALFLLNIVQAAKGTFRQITWNSEFTENKATLFGELLANEVNNTNASLSADKFFFFYVRANQGFLVASVMDYIPQRKDFDNGSYLIKTFISSFVPRLFWPDKPKAGGKFTMEYYAGITLEGQTSMNVSPVGEAYGSFGPTLGIFYLMLLGYGIRSVYKYIFILSNKIPFIIFWIPVVFFQVTYAMETDSLQIFNSVIKSAIFIAVVYRISPKLFGINEFNKKNKLLTQ